MYVTLKIDNKGRRRIHSFSDGNEEIVTDESCVVMLWKMVNVDGKRVTLDEVVDEIFSYQDALTNSTYVTLKLDDKSRCRIHSFSDGNRETESYVVMPWKMVTRYGKNMTLKEIVDEIIYQTESKAKELERRTR